MWELARENPEKMNGCFSRFRLTAGRDDSIVNMYKNGEECTENVCSTTFTYGKWQYGVKNCVILTAECNPGMAEG